MVRRLRAGLAAVWADRSGATAIEYAMVAIFIGIVLIAAMASIGTSVSDMFMSIANGF